MSTAKKKKSKKKIPAEEKSGEVDAHWKLYFAHYGECTEFYNIMVSRDNETNHKLDTIQEMFTAQMADVNNLAKMWVTETQSIDRRLANLATAQGLQAENVVILLGHFEAMKVTLTALAELCGANLARANKQDQQIDRLIQLMWILARAVRATIDPALEESIRRDLRAPTLPDPLEPGFRNRSNPIDNCCDECGGLGGGHFSGCSGV